MADDDKQKFLEATTHTISWFWKRFGSEELELQPPFQRNPVWQEKQQAYLIDTILKGYPIPELYVQTLVDGDGDERYVVVDGQQRIRACLEFLNDEYVLGEESGNLAGLTFSDLDDDDRKRIFGYKFVVRELPDLSNPEIRQIFERLNRNNVALNPQEIRHATYWGEFITSMTKISQDDFWVTSGLFTSRDIRRMIDIEFVSEIAVANLFGLQNKKQSLDNFYKNFESEFPDRKAVEKTFRKVLGELSQLLDWPTSTRWSKKTDFYTLFLVIAKHEADLPFDADTRTQVGERLKVMSAAVGDRISEVETSLFAELAQARGYARGVRASSDLGSRRLRDIALESCLFDLPYELPADLVESEEDDDESAGA